MREGVRGPVVFPVICRKETKWEVECAGCQWAGRPATRPASGSLALSLRAASSTGPSCSAPGRVSAPPGCIRGRLGRGFGQRRAGSPTCPGTLTLGASWSLASGQWIPSELVCWDLDLSCPRGSRRPLCQHLPCTSISPKPVLARLNRGTKGSPARQ